MARLHPAARDVGPSPEGSGGLAFAIGALVTDPHHNAAMVESFREKGVAGDDCAFIHIDNTSGNVFDADAELNRLLNSTRGAHVILCHQDIRLNAGILGDTAYVIGPHLGHLRGPDAEGHARIAGRAMPVARQTLSA